MPGSSSSAQHRLLAYAGLYFFWGTTFLAIRVLVPFVPPFFLTGLRHFSAGLLLLAFARSRGTAWPTWRQALGSAALGILFQALANGTCAWAMQYVESGYATLFIAGVPLVAVAYGATFQGKSIRLRELALLLLGLAGVGLLLLPSFAAAHVSAWAGLAALAGATIVWSIAMAEKDRFAAPKDAWMATSMQMLGGGAFLLLATSAWERPWAVDWAAVPAKAWAAWAYLGIFGSCVGYGAFNYLLQRDPPHLVGTYSYVNPLVAVTLGHLLLGEKLSPVIFVSSALVVASVAGLLWMQRRTGAPVD